MATTVYLPLDLRSPRVATLAGNCFWTVTALTAYDAGHFEFVKDVDGKLYGLVLVPKNVNATPNAGIVLSTAYNATTGVSSWIVSTAKAADGATLNPASLTAESVQSITVPGTARLRKDVIFPASGNLGTTVVAGDLLMVELFHNGLLAADTVAVNSELHGAFLRVDL